MNERDRHLFIALREQAVGIAMTIDEILGTTQEEFNCAEGVHPSAGRKDVSAMGIKRFLCAACSEVVEAQS